MVRKMRSTAVILCLLASAAHGQQATPDKSSADASSSAVSTLGPVEKVQGGFQFTEGPTYASDGALFFSDIPANTIFVRREGSEATPFISPSGHANGLMFEAGGRLVACQMDGQLVAYDLQNKQAQTLAAEYQGKRFNAPNDLVIDNNGGVYFTDPLFRSPEPLPQGVQACYYIAVDGQVSRISGDLPAPNGIALSPAGDRLYVIPSQSAEMLVYTVEGPGKVSEPRVLCKLRQRAEGENSGGDGMVVDSQGNLYITSNLGVQVFSPEGKFITLVEVPEQPANVTFGGADGNVLFITARNGLYAVRVSSKGLPAPQLAIGP